VVVGAVAPFIHLIEVGRQSQVSTKFIRVKGTLIYGVVPFSKFIKNKQRNSINTIQKRTPQNVLNLDLLDIVDDASD